MLLEVFEWKNQKLANVMKVKYFLATDALYTIFPCST